ncbi:MAG: site-specific DNA-methyltransferase [Verrucomicrobia bacterium]|jgi:hypothetical protein|nr:site-specific DNA-methyltransferase [Verrucomicrobiota bacterium]
MIETNDLQPGFFHLHRGDVLDVYAKWPSPDLIMVDGPYGIGGFFGDPRTPEPLAEFYKPHIRRWTQHSKVSTTLWFWCTEIGWANVHPLLHAMGWDYVQTIHWDKGIRHVAGNVNGKSIRRFPIVNEICVFYSRRLEFEVDGSPVSAKYWLRNEWIRTGLPLKQANEACGVKDAASRKYLDTGWLWYFPPSEMMQRLVDWANTHGDPAGRPYFSLDGKRPLTGAEWSGFRYQWNHEHGLTNVWQEPPLHGKERIRSVGRRQAPRVYKPKPGQASAHLNQKPLKLMRRILTAATQKGDVVWEPFGGLASAAVAGVALKRRPFVAEIDEVFADIAHERLLSAQAEIRNKRPGQPQFDL